MHQIMYKYLHASADNTQTERATMHPRSTVVPTGTPTRE